jgi:hypothetical protein
MGNYSAQFGGGHLEKGNHAPLQVSTLQRYPTSDNCKKNYLTEFWDLHALPQIRFTHYWIVEQIGRISLQHQASALEYVAT